MIPSTWQKHPIGKVCTSIVPGRNKPKAFDGNIPWVTTPEISGRYIPSELQENFVSEEAIKEAGGKVVPEGAVIIAAVGELGLVAIANEPVVLNQQLHAFVCPKTISNEYLAYWLATQRRYMESVASKTTIPYMNKASCESIPVLLPPLQEQKKIAQILSTWDKAISTTENLLKNSQQQKKALMQQLLTGKKRLLDDNGVRFNGEWRKCRIEEYFDVGSSKRVLQEDWKNKGVPFYRTRELVSLSKNEKFRSEIFISEDLFLGLSEKYGVPSEGDFLISGVGTLGISYQVKHGDRFYFKDGNVLWLKKRPGVNSDFFKYSFDSKYVQNQIKAQASITTVGTYTITNARKTKFLCPPTLSEQEKISEVMNACDDEILMIQLKLKKLKKEKKALMQQLLTGKKRVKLH